MSGGNIQLLGLDRDDGERLVVRWLDSGQGHTVEIAIERRTLDGWELRRRIFLQLAELWTVRDGLDRACSLAMAVRR